MHIPPKPFRARAMNISTDRAAIIKNCPQLPLGCRGKGDRALTCENLSGSTPSGYVTLLPTQHPSAQPHRLGGTGLSSKTQLRRGWKGSFTLMIRLADPACLMGLKGKVYLDKQSKVSSHYLLLRSKLHLALAKKANYTLAHFPTLKKPRIPLELLLYRTWPCPNTKLRDLGTSDIWPLLHSPLGVVKHQPFPEPLGSLRLADCSACVPSRTPAQHWKGGWVTV